MNGVMEEEVAVQHFELSEKSKKQLEEFALQASESLMISVISNFVRTMDLNAVGAARLNEAAAKRLAEEIESPQSPGFLPLNGIPNIPPAALNPN